MFQGTCLVAVAVYFGDDEYADDGDDDDIGDGDDVFFKLLQNVGSLPTVEGKVKGLVMQVFNLQVFALHC